MMDYEYDVDLRLSLIIMFGWNTPFVLRPMEDKPDVEGDIWDIREGADGDFEGADDFKKALFRFSMGECYLHERMTGEFLDEASASLPSHEIFNVC